MIQNNGNCEVCGIPTKRKCKQCMQAFFCCIDHHNAVLENHMRICKPFKIFKDPLGRPYIKTTRAIEEGTVILEELPLILAPSKTPAVCLGCFNILNSNRTHPCKKCKWPFCSAKCQYSPMHYPECHYRSRGIEYVTVSRPLNVQLVHRCILILRCLYHKEYFPLVWEKIKRLESHYQERQMRNSYQADKQAVMDTLYSCFGLKGEFTEDEIMEVWSICLTNEQDAPIATPYPVAIYELSPLFEHNCWPNCNKSVDSQGVLRITAGFLIPKGQRLSICYTNPLWTTSNRQIYLERRFLKCRCDRCMDITEMSTYMSSVNCPNPTCRGTLLPETFVRPKSYWTCNKCLFHVPQNDVGTLLKYLEEELTTLKAQNDAEGIKRYLEKNKRFVPENHSYMVHAKLVLMCMLGGLTSVKMHGISYEDLELKEYFCRQLLEHLAEIAPAEKRIIGYVHYNLELCLEQKYQRKIIFGESDVDDCRTYAKTLKSILDETVNCLKYESAIMVEGKLCTQAIRKLQGLNELLLQVQPDDMIIF